jgi:hypothetical protein
VVTRKDPVDNWSMTPPEPRTDGDRFTPARQIINEARLDLPAGSPRPNLTGFESTEERRRILAAFLREHGVAVPAFVPYRYGWLDTYTGEIANPSKEDA